MRLTETGLSALKQFEVCHLKAFRDSLGIRTIGYGHTFGVKAGDEITEEIADKYLREDVEIVESGLSRLGLDGLTDNQWDAVVDFVFNLGATKFIKSELLKMILKNPKDKDIPSEFKRWVYARGKAMPNLIKRRQWEASRWVGKV